jgi:hypothetical protein
VGRDQAVDIGLDPALSARDDKEEARVGSLITGSTTDRGA